MMIHSRTLRVCNADDIATTLAVNCIVGEY